jgi:hypothetical protein
MKLLSSALVGLMFAGCQAETMDVESFDGLSLESLGGEDSHANLSIENSSAGYRVTLTGAPAASLMQTLRASGLYQEQYANGKSYLVGYYVGCVSGNGSQRCVMHTSNYSVDEPGTLVSVHGPRFNSAASELFGASAWANGNSPATVTETSHGIVSCSKNTQFVWCALAKMENTGDTNFRVSLEGLGDLGPDYVYEGWLITGDGPVAAGRFSMSGASTTADFTLDAEAVAEATMYVLTIEPAVGDDPAPSNTHVVAGVIGENGSAELTTAHPAALGSDFSEAVGGYILAAPSTANADDDTQGIWFLDPSAGPGASLHLPSLPAGWAYEGWVVVDGAPQSTGRFTSVLGEDSDGAGASAGPDATPHFPGQDFISPALDLVGGTVVISIEPEPDNAAAPFFFKPLIDGAVSDSVGQFQALQNAGLEVHGTAMRL